MSSPVSADFLLLRKNSGDRCQVFELRKEINVRSSLGGLFFSKKECM